MSEPYTLGVGKVVASTIKALCVKLDDAEEDLWIPRSVVHDDSEVYDDDQDGEVVVQEWWARKLGLAD